MRRVGTWAGPAPRGSTSLLCLAFVLCASLAAAQQMPDPSQINGKAIPAPELPTATVTVRVVRESIGNNIPQQVVKVTEGSVSRTRS